MSIKNYGMRGVLVIGILLYNAGLCAAATPDTGYCIIGPEQRDACVDPNIPLVAAFQWVIRNGDLAEFKQRLPLLRELDELEIQNELQHFCIKRQLAAQHWLCSHEVMPEIIDLMNQTYLHPTEKKTKIEIERLLDKERLELQAKRSDDPVLKRREQVLLAVSCMSWHDKDHACALIKTIESNASLNVHDYLRDEHDKCEAITSLLTQELHDFEHRHLKSGPLTQNLFTIHRKSRPDRALLPTALLRNWKDTPESEAKREMLLNVIDRDEDHNCFDEVLQQLAQEDFVSTSLVGLDIETCVYGLNAYAACKPEEIEPVLALGQKLQAGDQAAMERVEAMGERPAADIDRTLMLARLFNTLDLASERAQYAGYRLWWGIARAQELFGTMEEPEKSQCLDNGRARLFGLLKKVHASLDNWKVKHEWIDNPDPERWGSDSKVLAVRIKNKQRSMHEL